MAKHKAKTKRKAAKVKRKAPKARAARKARGRRPAAAPGEVRYASPSYLEIKCPRCGSPNTEAQGTNGPIQRRKCLAPTCRHPFKVARRRILAQEQ